MQTRLDAEATPAEKGSLWTGAFVMLGLKYNKQVIDQLWKGVIGMKESITYQMILKEGEAAGIAKSEAKGDIFH